jgi:hypothetical protein
MCKYYYTYKVINASSSRLFNVTKATSAATNYLS